MNMNDAQTLAEQIDRLIKLNIKLSIENTPCPPWDTEGMERVRAIESDIKKLMSDLVVCLTLE